MKSAVVKTDDADKLKRWHATWGSLGSGDGQFDGPRGIAVAAHDIVYVSDKNNNRIQCFTPNGAFIHKWGREGKGYGEFQRPLGMAIAVDKERSKSVMRVVTSLSPLSSFPPGLLPICVAYADDENIAIVDNLNHRLQIFQTEGTFVRTWGQMGNKEGQFRFPTDCDIDGDDGLYVADTGNSRIQVFRMDGTFVRKWRCYRGSRTRLFTPLSVSVSITLNLIYIHDLNKGILCCDLDGKNCVLIVRESNKAASIHVDSDDDMIYMGDDHFVKQFRRKDGAFVRRWGTQGNVYPNFGTQMGLAKGRNDILYVADTDNHCIVLIRTK